MQVQDMLIERTEAARKDIDGIIERQQIVHTSNPAYFDMQQAFNAIHSKVSQPRKAGKDADGEIQSATNILQELAHQYSFVPEPSSLGDQNIDDQENVVYQGRKVSSQYVHLRCSSDNEVGPGMNLS